MQGARTKQAKGAKRREMASIVFQVESFFRLEILFTIFVEMQLPSETVERSDFEYMFFSGILFDVIMIGLSLKQSELEGHNSWPYHCESSAFWKRAENVSPRKLIALVKIKLPQTMSETVGSAFLHFLPCHLAADSRKWRH